MSYIKETDDNFVINSYSRYPVEVVSGKGALWYDSDGKEYIDMTSGIGVNSFGACDNEWINDISAQLKTIQHTSNLYYTNPSAKLAKLLCEKTGFDKVFFSNSGAEANECAIKAARKYAFDKYGDFSHSAIVTLNNSFHGRTVTTLSATAQDCFHREFGPYTDGFLYADANDLDDIKSKCIKSNACAVMLELIQGEGGVNVLSQQLVESLREFTQQNDILLIIDEVQTGNGRTGKLYAYMNYKIKPDIVTTAKGLGGGLPIGATLFSDKTSSVLTYGTHGSTFGANPVCCAGALSILKRLDDDFLSDVIKKSDYIKKELATSKKVESISGMGLLLGISVKGDNKKIISELIEKGVLTLSAKEKIRLLPPLNIEWDALKKAVEIMKEVLS